MYRSTKGASKARRDQINAEIRNLKDLLPISETDKARLSYLHIMSLACMYTRKSVFFSQEVGVSAGPEESAAFLSFHELSELMEALPGFLMLLTEEGKLLYLSDSVSEHLGHSMVDLVSQGDSVYDIIDASDHVTMRTNLSTSTSAGTDRLFRCRFNTTKSVRRQSAGNKLILIRARCLSPPSPSLPSSSSPTPAPAVGSYWSSNPVWVCFCAPLESQPTRSASERESSCGATLTESSLFLACFHSQHARDLRLQTAQDSVSSYLGLDVSELRTRSWYSLIHPQDLSHATAQHRSLLREGGEGRAEMVVRVHAENQSWLWLYMVLQLQPGDFPISSNNFIISESEAWSVRQQLSSEQNQLSLVLTTGPTPQESLQSSETLSSPDQVFTPGSSGLSGQSFDFSSTEHGGVDPRSSISSLEEETFFPQQQQQKQQQQLPSTDPHSAASSPTPVTVETVSDLDFLTQNILLPPSFQLDPPLPALPLPLPPPPASPSQQSKEFVCTPPYTPHLTGVSFPFNEPLFSFDPTGTTTPPPSSTTQTSTASIAPSSGASAPPPPTSSSTPPPAPTTLSAKLPLALPAPSTELLYAELCGGSLYEKLPPTPDSPGDGDCTVMTLPEVRGPLYVDVPLGPAQCPPEGLLTPEASPGKQACASFFSLDRGEKEHQEISLLAQHLSFYLDPLLSKLSPSALSPSSSPPSPFMSPTAEGSDSHPLLRDLYPVKPWRVLDFPSFPEEDDSMFEQNVLESLLQDDFAAFLPPPLPSNPPSPASPHTPACWLQSSHFEGGGHICSVQSTQCNSLLGAGAGGELTEEPMEVEMASSPASSCSSIPASPPLAITAASPVPVASPPPAVARAQSLLEELVVLEPVFGAGASIAPGLGQQPELYQLQCRAPPQCFHEDGSGSVPPF